VDLWRIQIKLQRSVLFLNQSSTDGCSNDRQEHYRWDNTNGGGWALQQCLGAKNRTWVRDAAIFAVLVSSGVALRLAGHELPNFAPVAAHGLIRWILLPLGTRGRVRATDRDGDQ